MPIQRRLNQEESILLKHLLAIANDKRANEPLPDLIEVMGDGEMGSIQFGDRIDRKFARDIIQVEYIDTDDVLVLITLVEDNFGNLFELDFWKVDFNKLIEYPTPSKILIRI